MIHRSWSTVLLLLLWAAALPGCHPSTGPSTIYGAALPRDEAEFDALGEAMITLDADEEPLRQLDPLVGDWLIDGEYFPWPDAAATMVSPVCQARWILGGRCLELRYQYYFQGETIRDLVLVRWNPLDTCYDLQMYSSSWPLPNGGSGRWNDEGNILDFVITTTNAATSEPVTTLYRLDAITPNAHRWRQYRTSETGQLTAFFTMNARRALEEQP
ncbi:MAG: DUF1579 domain-containing protein [Phycisphaerales bacterium]|nr:DUF1579 domain-containing protein [Phycisphaerales bacterium]